MAESLLGDLAKLRDKQRSNTEAMLRFVDTVGTAVDRRLAAATSRAASATAATAPDPKLDAVMTKLAGACMHAVRAVRARKWIRPCLQTPRPP